MLPGQVRIWQAVFSKEKPEALRWGFRKYFETGTFPPKPSDIASLIRQERESPYFGGWDDSPQEYAISGPEDYEQAKASRQEYFDSREYKAWLERMRKERGI